jgi:hypothetical protein
MSILVRLAELQLHHLAFRHLTPTTFRQNELSLFAQSNQYVANWHSSPLQLDYCHLDKPTAPQSTQRAHLKLPNIAN